MTVVTHYTNPTVVIETPDGVSDNGKDEEAAIGGGGGGDGGSMVHLEVPAPFDRSRSRLSVISSSISNINQTLQGHVKGKEELLGTVLALISGTLFAGYSKLVKGLKQEIAKDTILLVRGVMQTCIAGTSMACQGLSPKAITNTSEEQNDNTSGNRTLRQWLLEKKSTILLFITLGLGSFRLKLLFNAFSSIPIYRAHAIINSAPVFVMLLSHFLMNDKYNVHKGLVTIGFVGGLLTMFQPWQMISEPDQMIAFNSTEMNDFIESFDQGAFNFSSTANFSERAVNFSSSANFTEIGEDTNDLPNVPWEYAGYACAFVAAVLSAMGQILNKKLTSHFHKEAIFMYLGLAIIAISNGSLIANYCNGAESAPVFPVDGTWTDLIYLWSNVFFVALMGCAQQYCLIWALKLISPTRVAIPRSVNILVSFLLESADEPFEPIEILGGICIFATIAFAAQEKNLIEKSPLLGKSLLNCDKDSCSASTENPPENPEDIEERASLKMDEPAIIIQEDKPPV